ncbi:MAG: galactosamine-6-phosphate isomerase [Saprospiraceae bacterium]|jgi:galactosamine-6-phosphate isomerase
MNIQSFENEDALALNAANLIVAEIKRKPNLLLCAATGNTPLITYQNMVEKLKIEEAAQLRILKLDEWGGIPISNKGTCEHYLQKHLLNALQIPKERYFGFRSQAEYPNTEIERIKEILRKEAPIDICILGLGANGHIAFNEPADALNPNCHIAHLSQESLQHTMTISMVDKPNYGLTLGMAEILQSKMIIMLITGSHKKEITKAFLSKKITTQVPASFLWLHPNVHCFVDKVACG